MKREQVYKIIDSERNYQDEKWGGEAHDEGHNLAEWFIFIEKQIEDAKEKIYNNYTGDPREELRKIAALAVAAMEINGINERQIKAV